MATEFTPISSLAGGALIGASAVLLMALYGRIAGISGIASRLFPPYLDGDFAGRCAFILGIVAAPVVYGFATARAPVATLELNGAALAIAGVLVGFGAVWGGGCTSGHGVCGLSRLSVRSFFATSVFMVAAVITVFATRHIW